MVFLILVFFVLGSAVGSFLNVLADRSVSGQSIMGRSHCDWCKARLNAVDLVPVLSFLILGGRCRRCKKPLSWQYPIVEFTSGVLFVLTVLFLDFSNRLGIVSIFYYLFIVSILIVVSIVDLKHYLIPTTFTLIASLVALFYNYFNLGSGAFVENVLVAFGAALFFLIIVLVTFGKGMGEGDIFLAFLIGMVLGFKETIVAIFAAFIIGAVVALFLVAFGKKRFGQAVPFGPFLVLGFFISLFWGELLLERYLMLY